MHYMKPQNLIATAQTIIKAPASKVWAALTEPDLIKQYMFGATVKSDWKKGSEITWEGEMNGKPYHDKGEILVIDPDKTVSYTHYSPLAGLPDQPESYHTVTIELSASNDQTRVTLTQDKNDSEKAKEEAAKNWNAMLEGLRKVVQESLV